MLKVQKFLKVRSLEELKSDPFNLLVTVKDDLVLLKYNQFNSDFSNEIVKECRGLILEKDTWNVVCHPFHKFFNLGEVNAYKGINLTEAVAAEKVDGSIIKIFYYGDKWCIATNGTIDASDATTDDGVSFKDLFYDVISKPEFEKLVGTFDTKNTYLFEIVHSAIQIVVDYQNKKELVLLGIIKNENVDGVVYDYDILNVRKKMEKSFKGLNIRYPRFFDMSNVSDVAELESLADIENVNGNTFEGYVASQLYNGLVIGRVKIKSPKYVNLHHLATGEGVTNHLIEVLTNNELDEFEVYLKKIPKQIADEYVALKKRYFALIDYLYKESVIYREKSNIMTRKDLALSIIKDVKRGCSGFIFKMVDDNTATPELLLNNVGVKKIKELLK